MSADELRSMDDLEQFLDHAQAEGAVSALHKARADASPAQLRVVGIGFAQMGEYDEAAQTLTAAAEAAPGDWEGWLYLAEVLTDSGHLDRAFVTYLRAIDADPDDEDVVEEILQSILDSDLDVRAVEIFTDRMAVHPAAAALQQALGLIHGQADDHESAAEAFHIALELSPDNPRLRYNLAQALNRTGQSTEAWRVIWEQPRDELDGPARADLYDAPVSLRWSEVAKEFVRNLHYAGWARIPLLRSESTDSAGPTIADGVLTADFEAGSLRSRLEVHPEESGARFVVVAIDEMPVQPPDLELWREVVDEALGKLGRTRQIPWYAIIGTTAPDHLEPSDQRLAGPAQVHGLALRPCADLTEFSGITAVQEDERSFSPILVAGSCDGSHDWGIEAHEEAVQVRRLCALLSLAWNRCWTVKVHPQTDEVGLTESAPAEHEALVEVEPWISSAWNLLEDDPILTDAINAFYEGMLLSREHPSMAMVAFITCCEITGRRLTDDRHTRKRIEKALRSVLDDAGVAELLDAYGLRNKTAHEGKLHAYETAFGLLEHRSKGEPDTSLYFTLGLLRRIRTATRDMLLSALTA